MSYSVCYKVSIIIPVYNAVQYVEEAVRSVVNLPETGEILLIDDGSKDSSLEQCHRIEKEYSKVTVYVHPDKKNHGPAASRNIGIKNARFDYISFLDADDYYLPNRFTLAKEIFMHNPDIDGVYGCTQAVFTNESVRKQFLENYESDRTTVSRKLTKDELFKTLLFGGNGTFHTSGITLHKNAFKKAGIFNQSLRQAEDTEFWLRLCLKTTLYPGSIDEPISIRRVHETNSIHKRYSVAFWKGQMHQVIFDWSIKEPLSFAIKNSFFVALCQVALPMGGSVKKIFWKQAGRNFHLIFSTFFLKKIHQLYFIK